MAGPLVKSCLLTCSLLALSAAQAPSDPIGGFCRRYGHQTAVIDRKLYIDGGWVYANPISDNPVPTINEWLIYSDLDNNNGIMPEQHTLSTKNNSVPAVAGGILWPDEVNKVFWLYGGQYSTAPSRFQLWGYDTLMNQWNISLTATASDSSIERVAYGAGTTFAGRGYYYGGYLNNLTNPSWTDPPQATSSLIIFDMDTGMLKKYDGPDSVGRAEGVMVSIPASKSGMLIYFGGVTFPYGDTTEVPMEMSQIVVYDIGDERAYVQTAYGDVPANRRKFCAGAAWAEDHSSYNIYLYGGFGFGENATGFDDSYILTMPTFEWIKWYPTEATTGNPHGDLTCDVIANAQMIVMGGNFTYDDHCDAPTSGGQHNLNLGRQNINGANWYEYLPNLTSYAVPEDIFKVTGGSADGGASNRAPANGFDDGAFSTYFSQQAQLPTRTPTRYIASTAAPTPTNSANHKSNIGAIAGGAVGGVVILIIALVALWWFCIHKRRSTSNQGPQPHQTSAVNELTGDSRHEHKSSAVVTNLNSPGHSSAASPQPHASSPYNAPGPMQPVPYGQYPNMPHGGPQQQYYPMQMHPQHQGYGYPQQYPQPWHAPGGSPPEGFYPYQYPQQTYFPPPDTSRHGSQPNMQHEMPTSRTPAIRSMSSELSAAQGYGASGVTRTSDSQSHSVTMSQSQSDHERDLEKTRYPSGAYSPTYRS